MSNHSDSILTEQTAKISNREFLSESDISRASDALAQETISAEAKSLFLTAWEARGETAEEIGYLASCFRKKARNPQLDAFAGNAIDIVGTGGDKAGTFNISTTTAMLVASAGVPVIKHGNRSITSKTGGADLLESVGIPLDASNELLQSSLEKTGFAFLFAPAFHPAFKSIMPVRKALAEQGRKTVFNILGPLINPAKPAYQLLGVFNAQLVEPIAKSLGQVGIKKAFVANSLFAEQPMDEITTIGHNTIAGAGAVTAEDVAALQQLIGSKKGGILNDLKGGGSEENLRIFEEVIRGKANEALMNTICVNAAAAFFLVGKTSSLVDGFELARTQLANHGLLEWVEQCRAFYRNEA